MKQPLRKAARDVKGRHSTNWRSCSVSTVSLLLPFTSFLFHHLPCPEPDGLLNGNRATKPALQNPLSSEQHRNILRSSYDNSTDFPAQPVQGKALHCVYCHRLSSCFLKLDVGRVLMHSHCCAVMHTNPCLGGRYDRFKLIICTSRVLDK